MTPAETRTRTGANWLRPVVAVLGLVYLALGIAGWLTPETVTVGHVTTGQVVGLFSASVLLNLVQNAQQAMAKHPGPRVLTLSTAEADGRVRVEVHDTGPGIPPETLPRIFDAFFTTKPAGEGTGLGLWVSYGIIEQHQGRLSCESRPDGGATFIVELPFRKMPS